MATLPKFLTVRELKEYVTKYPKRLSLEDTNAALQEIVTGSKPVKVEPVKVEKDQPKPKVKKDE